MKHRIPLLLIVLLFGGQLFGATISGYVLEKKSGEPVIYAAVSIRGTNLGYYTNKKGYFVINSVPRGPIQIGVQQIGFKPNLVKIEINRDDEEVFLNIEIERQAVLLKEVVVKSEEEAKEFKVNTRDIKVSNIMRRTEDLQAVVTPVESDVFRALQTLPGVASISDFSNALYVRGGSADQNLILLDGIDVYNPQHFGGIFSTFNTDAVKGVELLKGGYPAIYGGRLSSVLDVTNKDGNRKDHHGVARLSLISSTATLEGPWKLGNESGSYMASYRRTYLDLMAQLADLDIPDYYFYDGHAKVNWDYSDTDKFSVSTYFGKDAIEFKTGMDMLMSWGNETLSTQWTHVFNPQLFSHFILAGSHFFSKFRMESESDQYMERLNDIYDVTFRAALTWKPVEEHMVDFGISTKYNSIDFESSSNTDVDTDHMPTVEVDSRIVDFYIQDSWDFLPNWTLQPGLRFTSATTNSLYLDGEPEKTYLAMDERLSLRYKIDEFSNVYAAFGTYHQYLNMLSMGESSPMDLWFPIDKSVDPGEADHYLAGYKREINEMFALDFEGYYKDYRNLIEYRPETDYEWDNENGVLADVLNMGEGYAYGADMMLRNDWMGLRGFIGYGYCIAKRKLDNVNLNPESNEPESYFPAYDRTHQINVVETYNMTEYTDWQLWGADVKFSLTFAYHTGQPYAKPEHAYWDGERFKFLYSYKDRYRLPNYSRLDLGVNLYFPMEGWSIEPYFQVINALNVDNVWFYSYYATVDDNGQVKIHEDMSEQLPFLPFVGVNVQW